MRHLVYAFIKYTILGGFAFFATAASAQQFHVVNGTWITQNGTEITIAPCPQGLCGAITKIVMPQEIIDKYGAEAIAQYEGEYKDINNENPALRERPIQDLVILTLVSQEGPNKYNGQIYNPQDGKTYDGFVQVVTADHISMNGCIAWGTVCSGEDWFRAPPPPMEDLETASNQ